MQSFKVQITGKSPYMQHRMDDQKLEEWEKSRRKIIERDGIGDDDYKTALFHAHLDENGEPYIPADHIRGSLIEGGKMHSAKIGNRSRSMTNVVAGQFLLEEDRLPIIGSKMIVDKRSAVNNNNKARIIVKRPKWATWKTEFTLNVDNDDVTKEMIEQIITSAGKFIGIGSYRPTCKGTFGRFELTKFKKVA